MSTTAINTYIDFICFHLSECTDTCAKMVLQRVACDPEENVDQSIVAQPGKECLLITFKGSGG